MRAAPQRPTGLLAVMRVGILAGVLPLAMFFIDQWAVTEVRDEGRQTRAELAAEFDALREHLVENEDAAHLDRLCLIEALLAVRDALQGDEVPPGLPPACATIVTAEGAPPP